ncbi:MAG: hypothetical protein KFF68_15495, partial [Desulfosarcina sp.]|nr:hypothetical protein [Desulfosarcina sp.]
MNKQTQAYVQQAQAYESQGNLVEALEQYKLAQTIDPDEPVIIDEINRLEKKLNDLAETHYRAGIRFRDKGKWDLAKKEFLKALRYRPDHKQAAAMLQQRQPEGESAFITHEITPGESISKLALKYYGDYKKYHHIVNFNNMSDATQVRVGQRVMVPVIDGVTIADLNRISAGLSAQPPAVNKKAPASQPVAEPSATPVDSAEAHPPEAPEPVDQVAEYRETGIALFNEKKYDEA